MAGFLVPGSNTQPSVPKASMLTGTPRMHRQCHYALPLLNLGENEWIFDFLWGKKARIDHCSVIVALKQDFYNRVCHVDNATHCQSMLCKVNQSKQC